MTVPGSNVLRMALRVLGRQTVVLYRYAARATVATGREVTVYAAPAVVTEGSVQAVPRTRYASMGLDLTRSYVTWFTTASVRGIERDRAPDTFLFGGRRYDVTAVTPWNLQDGWNEILGVDVGPASEIPNMTIQWPDIEPGSIPPNITSVEDLLSAGYVQRSAEGVWTAAALPDNLQALAALAASGYVQRSPSGVWTAGAAPAGDWSTLTGIPDIVQSLAALTGTGILARINSGALETVQGLVHVEGLEDLPEPVGGVITLAANVTYMFLGTVDLGGLRLVGSQNTAILGGSSENSQITSGGIDENTPLISSEWSLPIRSVSFQVPLLFDLDAGANPGQALDWFGVNAVNCARVGRIANYSNFIATDCALLGSAEMVFDGEFATVGFSSCLFSGLPGATTLRFPATFTATRRVRAIYSAFVTQAGGTAIYVDPGASILDESYILDTVNISGPGTATGGIQYTDNRAFFTSCKGVTNTNVIAAYSMSGNATATTYTGTNVPAKVAGITMSAAITQKFAHSNNRATFTGGIPRDVLVSAVLSVVSASPNLQVVFYVARNGIVETASAIPVTTNSSSRAESVALQWPLVVGPGDYVEIWSANQTNGTSTTVTNLNTIVRALT